MLANFFTVLRVVLAPVTAAAILRGSSLSFWLFGFAALTDMVDGQVARRLGQETSLGKVLDALADRLLTVCVVVAVFVQQGFPGAWAVALMLARDIIMAVGAVVLASRGVKLEIKFVSKVATTVLFVAYAVILAGSDLGHFLFYVGLALYLWAGLLYGYEGKKVLQASRQLSANSRT